MADGSKRPLRDRTTLLALVLALAAAGGVAAANLDSLVERGFSAALGRPAEDPVRSAATQTPVAGSEDYWLSAAGRDAPADVTLASLPGPVRLGATLSLAIAGEKRVFEVAGVDGLPAGVTRVDSVGTTALVVVTLREAGKPGGAVLRLVGETAGTAGPREIAAAPARPL
jgi:hypothetical protein